MNNLGFNNKPFSADSEWSYHLGQGFTRVHIEFESNKCHMQLIKLNFWEKVANYFLNIIDHKIAPRIDDKVITYPKEELEIDKKIEVINNQILKLQKQGHRPETIRNFLFLEEGRLFADRAFYEFIKKEKDAEADEKTNEQATEDQAFTKNEDQSTDTKSNVFKQEEKPQVEFEEPKENIESIFEESSENTLLPIPEAEPLKNIQTNTSPLISKEASAEENKIQLLHENDSDKSTISFMKQLGYGLLISTGVAIAAYFLKDGFGFEQSVEVDRSSLLENDIKTLNLQLNHYGYDTDTNIPKDQLVELQAYLKEVSKSLNKPQSNLDQTAAKINEIRREIDPFIKEISPKPDFETQLTKLCGMELKSPLTKEQLIAFGGVLPNELLKNAFGSESSLDYLVDRLKLMGTNQEQKKIAHSVAERISSYSELDTHLLSFRKKIQQILNNPPQKQLEDNPQEGDKIQKNQQEEDRVLAAWQKNLADVKNSSLASVKELLFERFIQAGEKGFFLMTQESGDLVHFFPETSKNQPFQTSWTLRYYSSNPNLATEQKEEKRVTRPSRPELGRDALVTPSGQTFKEIKGLNAHQVLNDDRFIAELILSNEELFALQNYISKESEISKLLSESSKKTFFNPNDFLLNNPLSNMIFEELGPEASLDLPLSTIDHFISSNRNLLIDDHHIYTLIKYRISSLAYAIDRAAASKTIDYLSLQEKSRILREIGLKLRMIGFSYEKQLLQTAPIVDESIGKRKIEVGQIPNEGLIPLRKPTNQITTKPKQNSKPIEFTKVIIPLPEAGIDLTIDEILKLSSEIHTKEVLAKFRSWSTRALENPTILKALNAEQATQLVFHLSELAEILLKNILTADIKFILTKDIQEASLILAETLAIADQLLSHGHFSPQETHLPIHEIVSQLQTIGGISQSSLSPGLISQAEKSLSKSSKIIFNEAIQQESYFSDSVDGMNRRDILRQTGVIPWDIKRQLSVKDANLLPVHIQNTVPKDILDGIKTERPKFKTISELQKHVNEFGGDFTFGIGKAINYYHKEHEKGALKSILEIVTSQARLQAKMFATNAKKFTEELRKHSPAEPQIIIDAIQNWSKIYNPTTLSRNLLEVLTEEQCFKLLESFGQIAQSLQAANFQSKLLPDPETMIMHLELITMADQVMAYAKSKDLTRFHLPLDKFSEIIRGDNIFFRTFDPYLENSRLKSIKNWFLERTNILKDNYYNPIFTEFLSYFNQSPYSIDDPSVCTSTREFTILATTFFTLASNDLEQFRSELKEPYLKDFGPEIYVNPDYVSRGTRKSPSWFINLRELTHSSLHALRSGYINPLGERVTPQSFYAKYTLANDWSDDFYNTKYYVRAQLEGIQPELITQHPEIPDGSSRGHQFSHCEMPMQKKPADVLNEIRDVRLKAAENYAPGIDQLPRSIYDIDIAMSKETNADKSIYNSEDYRIKWSLRANANLQTFLTVSTYLEHPEWFLQPKEQIEFLSLLFNADLLIKHLQEGDGVGPRTEAELAKFFHTQYLIHANKPELQAYFAEVGLRLSQYSEVARKNAPEIYQNIPIPQELEALANLSKKMFHRKDLSESERSTYASLYALSFLGKTEFTSQDIIGFYQAILTYHSDSPVKMVNTYHIDRQINTLAKKLEPELIKLLYPANQIDQNILKNIVGVIFDKKIELMPSKDHPLIFMDKDGTVEINLQDGSISQVGKEGIPVPMEARLSSAFKMIYGQEIYRGKFLDRVTFEFNDNHGFTNIIQKNKDADWTLYRKLDDSDTPFQCTTIDWMQWDTSANTNQPIQWLKSQSLLSQYTHWYKDGGDPEIRLIDKAGKLAFRIELLGQNIKRIVKKVSDDELILADIDQSAYSWCKQFDDAAHIHVWISTKTGKGQQIEFLRTGSEGMHFSLKNNKWLLDNSPQYAVAKHQIHPIFPGQTNFLLLKTDTGAQRLLIPRNTPKANTDVVNLSFEKNIGSLKPQRILTLDKNQNTGKFESHDIETNAYLAMLNLGHRNYQEAKNLLSKLAQAQQGAFPQEVIEIIDWIIGSNKLPSDGNPQAIAIRTYAAQIKADNDKKIRKDEGYEVPSELQKQYLKHIHGLDQLRMPPAEEAKLLLNGINSGNLPAHEAIATLQLTDPELARQAVDSVLRQRIYANATIDIQFVYKPSEPIPASPSIPRMPVTTPSEISELIIKRVHHTSQTLPKVMEDIFDYNSPWFSKLPSPIQGFFKKYENGVRAFQKERDYHEYELKDADKFNLVTKRLDSEQYDLSVEMEHHRFKILDLANALPKNRQQAQQHILKIEAGTVKPVTFESLVDIFIKGDLKEYQKLNPNISLEQAKEIDQDLQTFIDMVPEWEYRQRLITTMQAVEATKNDPAKHQAALKSFVKVSEANRKFPHDANRLLKIMEYRTGLYYRGLQIEKLGKMGFPGLETSPASDAQVEAAIHRITVGAGKTSRLLPSMLKYYAQEGKLALAIMPEAQLASAGKEFAHIMKEVYQIPTLEIEFTRQTATVEFLEKTIDDLENAIKKGCPVLTSGKSIKVLRNLYIENEAQLYSKKETHDLLRKVTALKKIVTTMEVSPIIDEAHKEFDPKVETNNPSGEALPLPAEYGVIILNMYEILSQDSDIQKLMHFNFLNKDPIPGAKPFSEERFHSEITPLLTKKLLQRLASQQQIDDELNALSKFYQGLSDDRKRDIENYLLNNSSDEVVNWVEQNREVRDQLALIRGELNVLLPLTLGRKFGERYGFANENDILPIPFASAEMPNFGSQFSLPYERYNYLVQALTHEGLRKPLFEKIIKDLQSQRLKELTQLASQGVTPAIGERHETEADKEFKKLFQTEQWNLDTADIEDKIYNSFKNQPEAFRHLVKTYALQQVKMHARNLKATSQHLGNIFDNKYHGFSGTPSDSEIYPGNYLTPQDEAVIGRMISLMAEQTFGKTHTLNIRDSKQILENEEFLSCNAFMDAGGLFAGENLKLIGDMWSAKTGKAVVRVDRKEGLVIKQSPQDKSIPLRASSIPLAQRIALMGQADIVGTDIDHIPDARGFVSVAATSSLSMVEQAAGRLRGIESGQTVEFIILEDDAILIKEALGLSSSHQLTSQDILKHLIINEAKKQMEDSEVALHHKLQAVRDNFVFNWLRDAELGVETENEKNIDELIEAIFFPTTTISPFELFGRNEKAVNKEIAFAREIEKLIGPDSIFVQKATPVFGSKTATIIDSLKSTMEAIVAKQLKYINDVVVFKAPIDMEQQQDIELEQNIQIEQNQQQEIEIQQEKIEQSPLLKTPFKHKHWGDAQTFQLNKETIVSSVIFEKGLTEGYLSNLPSVFLQNEETKVLADLFSSDLLVSCNFQQNTILKSPQKPAQFVFIAFNKEQKKHTLAFIDPKEALSFKQAYHAFKGDFSQDLLVDPIEPTAYNNNPGSRRRYDVILSYEQKLRNFNVFQEHTDLDVNKPSLEKVIQDSEIWMGDFGGRKAFGNDDVFDFKQAEFVKLWAQAQVFAGRFNFANDEQRILIREWLDNWSSEMSKSKSQPKSYFLNSAEIAIKKIFSSKEDLLVNYHKTDLGKIFAELKKQ
jgi:hypothetical protein